MATFIASGTAYSTFGVNTIPFYVFYSMFGFQRVGDLIWAAADSRCKGFLLGGIAGRTTLAGEGLQHQDGHSHLFSLAVPNLISYDPAFAYEIAVIVREGLRRMYDGDEDLMYYLAVYNEPIAQPPKPDGVDEGIVKGLYRFQEAGNDRPRRAQILGSGPMVPVALRAAELLAEHDVAADVWSATSYQQLRAEALEVERWNRLHPEEARRTPFVSSELEGAEGPVVAVSDSIKAVPDQVARWVPQPFVSLGTDGFGRSDMRDVLRRFFEVDAEHVVVATLSALAQMGEVKPETITEAIKKFELDADRPSPPSLR
jgi:pyruvate dehydrogenase E1 component